MHNIENPKKYPISILSPKGLSAVSIVQPLNNAKSGLFSMTAIYKISSKIKPERIYIGSSVNFRRRKAIHKTQLKNNIHFNQKLQSHANKYGIGDLKYEILELVMFKEDLILREQFYIDTLNPYFNICKTAGNRLGIKLSEETKEKIRLNCKGMTGRKHTSETKQKMSLVKIGKKRKLFSEETRKKMSKAHIGKKHSKETRKKISIAYIKRKFTTKLF